MSEENTLENISQKTPFVKNLTEIPSYPENPKRARAEQKALIGDKVTIIPLEGLDFWPGEEPKMGYWDSSFSLSKEINNFYDRFGSDYIKKLLKTSDKKQLWKTLQEKAVSSEIQQRFGDLDIRNLTPYQAVRLIYEIIGHNFSYNDLAAGNYDKYIASDEECQKISKDRFRNESFVEKYYLDNLPAEQLLGEKKIVCRHAAGLAAVLYETLKDYQDGVLLNGSFLIYRGLGMSSRNTAEAVEAHASNLLVRVGSGIDEQKPRMEITCIEPTGSFGGKYEKFDKTHKRVSQTITFLREMGDLLVPDSSKEWITLSEQYLERFPAIPSDTGLFSDLFSIKFQLEDEKEKDFVLNQELRNYFILKAREFLTTIDLTTADYIDMRDCLSCFRIIHANEADPAQEIIEVFKDKITLEQMPVLRMAMVLEFPIAGNSSSSIMEKISKEMDL